MERALLGFAIVVQTMIFVVAQGDLPVDDPLAYAENAHAIASDPAEHFRAPLNHPFAMRIGITLPLAALFSLFGVTQITTNLPSLLASIVILLVVYAAAPTARSKRIAIGFTVFSAALVRYGPQLDVDLVCGAISALSILLLARRRIAGAVALWFCAFLVKETTIWFTPVWLYVIAVDIRALGWRCALRRFAPGFVVGAALAVAYVVTCSLVWGDGLARVHGIDALAHPWAPRGRSAYWWLARMTWRPPLAFVATFGVAVLVGIAGARRIADRDRLWLVAAGSYLALFWFGSASTTAYVPLPINQPRMLMVALPCVLVVATLATAQLRHRGLIALVAAATVVPFAFALIAAIRRDHPEATLHHAIRADALRGGRVLVVCGDFRCLATVPYVFGYRVPPNLAVVAAPDFAHGPLPAPGTRVHFVAGRRGDLHVDGARLHETLLAPERSVTVPGDVPALKP